MGIGFVVFFWVGISFGLAILIGFVLAIASVVVEKCRSKNHDDSPIKAFLWSLAIVPIFIVWAICYSMFVDAFVGQGHHIGDSWSVSLSEKYCMSAVDDPARSMIYPCTRDL